MPLFFKTLFSNSQKLTRNEKWLFSLLGFFVFLSGCFRYIAHSEFWSIFYSKYLFSAGQFQNSLYSKFVFNFSLAWLHWLPFGNLTHLLAVKLLYSLIAGVILYSTYTLLLLKFPKDLSIYLIFALFFNPAVFWDLPQAKADLLCLMFLLLGGLSHFKGKIKISAGFIILSLLTTPKAILFLPLIIIPMFNERPWNMNFIFKFRFKIWAARGAMIAFMVLYFFKSKLFFAFNSYQLAFEYAKNLLAFSYKIGFFSSQNLFFVNDLGLFLILPFFVILLLGSISGVFKFSKKNFLWLSICFFYAAIVVVLYPLKHPYFLIPIIFLFLIAFSYFVDFDITKYQSALKKLTSFKKITLVLLFCWQLTGLILVTPLNWGFPQFGVIQKLENIAKINPSVLIADGMGALPRENNLPQFLGFLDPEANEFFFKSIDLEKPDLIFLPPRVWIQLGRLRAAINTSYVYINSCVLTKRVEIAAMDPVSPNEIIAALNTIFPFPLSIVSFREFVPADTNQPVLALCLDSNIEKYEWTIQDLKSCSKFVFFNESHSKLIKVSPVPYPYFPKVWDIGIREFLDFKNFVILDR